MMLTEKFEWRGREVRRCRTGSGPDVVFCHGTPWSSQLWRPFAEALSDRFTVHLWDMPGYGQSSKSADHRVSLDVQGELLADLVTHFFRLVRDNAEVFIDLPVLVGWGSDDTWIPVDRAHRLAELIPGAQLKVIEAAGHLVQLDQPVQLATTLSHRLTTRTATT